MIQQTVNFDSAFDASEMSPIKDAGTKLDQAAIQR
jgi:hypothetical protein